jgi:hypothetical protein
MTILSDLIAEAEELEQLGADLQSRGAALAAKLRAYRAGQGTAANPVYVGDNGRLTEAGIRYAEAAFAQGRGPSEIADVLGVTVPAIVLRRQNWQRARKAKF